MGIIGPKSGRAGHRKLGLVAVTGVAVFSMLTLSAVAFASGGPTLTKSGPANEGPYPYAYPASGKIQAGTGTTTIASPAKGVEHSLGAGNAVNGEHRAIIIGATAK